MIDILVKKIKQMGVKVIPLALTKKFFSTDIEVLFFPRSASLMLLLPLSKDGDDKWRIQPFDDTLKALDEIKNIVNSIVLICYKEELGEVVVKSDLGFLESYDASEGGNRRSIRISKLSASELKKIKKGETVKLGTNALSGKYMTISDCIGEIVSDEAKLETVSPVSQKCSQRATDFPSGHNVIFYGPPGTGKTRAASIVANQLILGEGLFANSEEINFADYPSDIQSFCRPYYYNTQFHPSFSYEDFFEGLRPVQIQTSDKSDVTYLVIPGVFKAICHLSRAYLEKGEYGIDLNVQYIVEENDSGEKISKWHIGNQSLVGIYRLDERKGHLTFKDKKVLLTGEHLNRNLVVEEGAEPAKSGIYPVKWFCEDESNNIDFVLFIDELNRGNPARIFGEALSLIEDTKRYGRKEQTTIILPYSREDFVVPPNLHLLCSMNSSDKSLMNLDQAFRRRFKFMYFPPAFEIVDGEDFKNKTKGVFDEKLLTSVKNHFVVINKTLRATGIAQENYIGHSYLLKLLRKSFFEIKNNKTTKTSEEIVRYFLRETWENELHGQVREIVGEFKFDEFCDNFANEVSKIKSNDVYLIGNEDIKKLLNRYLAEIQPLAVNFPWKKSA